MKSILFLAACAATALAQRVHFTSPTPNAQISSTGTFTVDLRRDNSPTSLQENGIAIGFVPCSPGNPGGPCPNSVVDQGLLSILYNGSYTPAFTSGHPELGFHQAFTFQGSQLSPGQNLIGVVHFIGIGAALFPTFEVIDVPVTVV